MQKRYIKRSFFWGISGIILIVIYPIIPAFLNVRGSLRYILEYSYILGSFLFIIGTIYYLKAKNRNIIYSLLVFLPIIGLILLAILKDKSANKD